jgi:hypothetical protein
MPLSDEERQAGLEKIARLVAEDFHVDFQNHYSIAAATSGLHPEQVNNELRNMLTHIARAIRAETIEDRESQLSKAKGHLETASRDCLKLASFFILKELKADSFLVQLRDGNASMPLRMKIFEAEEKFREARRAEVDNEKDALELMRAVNLFLQEIRSGFAAVLAAPGWRPTKWQAFKLWFSANWMGFCAGFVAGLLANLVCLAAVHFFSR